MRKKTKLWLVAISTSIVMGLTTNVFAAAKGNPTDTNKIMKGSDTAIELPDGGFLFGPGKFEGKNERGNKFVIDPKTTTYKVTTVENALRDQKSKFFKTNNSNPLLQSKIALPIGDISLSPTSKPVIQSSIALNANQSYSGTMNGSGWRYARYWFYPANNTGGPYLRWAAHGDSGVVIDAWSSPSTSTVINDGQVKYLAGPFITNVTSFASYNPARYSYYYVGNW
ncbi:hypothetical protein KII95_07925 [Leuconostoc gelidum subsp. aenigmaticum]|uniref:hypothetical protein n=1 Tax=Leuconostoc gelidum TaxID=1244 RepID=UPI001CC7E2D7|nr:hypothetical protein [Leuconostoc gelidum]MBZ6003940.1 hypothetical protein [Leuconostoc gelidum subsp. aenigmaticum]